MGRASSVRFGSSCLRRIRTSMISFCRNRCLRSLHHRELIQQLPVSRYQTLSTQLFPTSPYNLVLVVLGVTGLRFTRTTTTPIGRHSMRFSENYRLSLTGVAPIRMGQQRSRSITSTETIGSSEVLCHMWMSRSSHIHRFQHQLRHHLPARQY